MKAQKESSAFFNLRARSRRVVNVATPLSLYCRKRHPIPIVQEVVWTPGSIWTGSEHFGTPGFGLLTVHPVASRCNDYAIRWSFSLRHKSTASRLEGSSVWIPLREWIFCCVFCVLRRYRPLRRADHSSREVLRGLYLCLIVCNLETSTVAV